MAEISSPPNPNPQLPSSDSSSNQRTTEPGTKRLLITLSVLLSFLSGIPFLLKSTEIHRSPLPSISIDSLLKSTEIFRFQAVFLRSDQQPLDPSSVERLTFLISKELKSRTTVDPASGGCGKSYNVSVTVDSGGADCVGDRSIWRCGCVEFSGLDVRDELVDGLLDSAIRSGGGVRVYTVVVVEREGDVRVVVGKHRHAWVMGKLSEGEAVEMIGEIFVKFFMNGGREEGEGKGEFMPVGSDGNVVLSFSLLNADPNDWVYDW